MSRRPDVAHTYATTGHQHGLSTASISGGANPANVAYTYDTAGNTATRTTTPTTGTAVTDTFTYTPTGRVASVSNPTGTSSYLYDAGGATLIRTDPLTGTTLYLGNTQVRLPVGSNTPTATRYYSFAGMTIAQRDTSTGLKALYNDPQGTSLVAISWTNLATRTRRTTSPYGVDLGLRNGPWPNPLSFGNQPLNTHTQLVDMGARLYDRDNGRFLQADPIIDPSNPDTLGGYTYAGDDPVNGTDFSGLMRDTAPREDSSAGTYTDQVSGSTDIGQVYNPKNPTNYKASSDLAKKLYELNQAKSQADMGVPDQCGGHSTSYDQSLDTDCANAALAENDSLYNNAIAAAYADALAAGMLPGTLDSYKGFQSGIQDEQAMAVVMAAAVLAASLVAGPIVGALAEALGGADVAAESVAEIETLAAGSTDAAAAAKSVAQGDHIVLGLRAQGLENTAATVGGRTLLKDPEWMASLQKAIGDPSTRFTVSLDGMSGSSTYSQVMGAAQRGAGGAGSYTDWEMAQLFQGGRLADTTFMRAGSVVENPFVS